ncbi:DUF2812 domain-containing protein [Gorillibacterium timonense]|uniref:DUF2812 domain-containing protein n=1 Tax=Gorillibacterium timonense TaxID=1689269 RepID=UPI00071E1B25|nr:DUF2812 domain-containing protein [Gorillibacterium timonense]
MSSQTEFKAMKWTLGFQEAEKWLTEQSAEGLHFDKKGIFRCRFRRDPSKRYEYRYDLQSFMIGRKKAFREYITLYEDGGWEYTDSQLWWHIFRRPFVEGQIGELYTDLPSRTAFLKRIRVLFLTIGWFNIACLALNFALSMTVGSERYDSIRGFLIGLNSTLGILLLYAGYRLKPVKD